MFKNLSLKKLFYTTDRTEPTGRTLPTVKARHLLATLAAVFFFHAACDSGGLGAGCDCEGFGTLPGGMKSSSSIKRAAQIRLSTHGIEFIENELPNLLATLLEGSGGLIFPLDEISQDIGVGDATICAGGCELEAIINDPQLETSPPDTVSLLAKLDLNVKKPSNGRIPVSVSALFININCTVRPTLNRTNQPGGKPVRGDIQFSINPATDRLAFDLRGFGATDQNGTILPDIIAEADLDLQCSGLLGGLVEGLFGLLIPTVNSALDIQGLVNDQLVNLKFQSCETNDECPSKATQELASQNAVCNASPTCTLGVPPNTATGSPENKTCTTSAGCLPLPLGLEGQFDVGALLADIAPGLAAKIDLSLMVGGGEKLGDGSLRIPPISEATGGGLTLFAMAGTESVRNTCVPETLPPVDPGNRNLVQEASFAYENDVVTENDPVPTTPAIEPTQFMAGIGISDAFVAKTLWDAFNAGALCINLGTAAVPQLSTSTLGILLPSLTTLAGSGAPVLLSFRPTEAPAAYIGRGTYKEEVQEDGTTKPVIDRPLILVSVPNFTIDFYGFIYGRYTWMFSLTTDLELPVGLQPGMVPGENPGDPEVPGITPIIDLSDPVALLKNIRAEQSEILAETPDALVTALPTLINAVLPLLAGDGGLDNLIPPIAIPAIQGIELEIQAVNGVDEGTNLASCGIPEELGGCYYFLGLFASLGIAPPTASTVELDTGVKLVSKSAPDRNAILGWHKTGKYAAPTIGVEFSASKAPEGATVEYSYRVDGGSWSPYHDADKLSISDPMLWLVGAHKIEVRSRVKGAHRTVDKTPASLAFLFDPVAPEVVATVDAKGIMTVKARDNFTPEARLQMAWSVDGVNYTDYAPIAAVSLAAYDTGSLNAWVRVRDEEGNETVARVTSAATNGGAGGNDAYTGGTAPGTWQPGTPVPEAPEYITKGPAYGRDVLADEEGGFGCSTRTGSASGAALIAGALALVLALRRRRRD